MKKTKMIVSLMLTLVMLLAMAIPAFAVEGTPAETTETKPSIKITNVIEGQTYTVYRMFELESYDKEANAYSYKPLPEWKNFVTGDGAGAAYFDVNADGYVTFKTGEGAPNSTEDLKTLAQKALEYAKNTTNGVSSVASYTVPVTDPKTTEYTFKLEKLGYYLVDSSTGTLCALTTTSPTVDIIDKNSVPTVTKTVDEPDVNYGDTVHYTTQITVGKGAQNYILHDTMDDTLEFNNDIVVKIGTETLTKDTDYEIVNPITDGHTFDIKFTKTLAENDVIVVTYTATLKTTAVPGVANVNETWVTYGDNNVETTHATAETYTWEFDVYKYTEKDGAEKPLAGAKFTLYKDVDCKEAIKLVKVKDGTVNDDGTAANPVVADVYRIAVEGDAADKTVTEFTTNASGRITIKGLDSKLYYLKELEAPKGYNLPAQPITTVDINAQGKINATETKPEGVTEIKILNLTGTELPSTGGVGTTIFYIVGGVLLVGAGLALVVRRRMNAK